MARARNIKPSFFKNEDLAELAFSTRLLFIGLWTMADRAGRLEDRPKRIKMELFPADDVDVDAGLDDLARFGFIERYEAAGARYVQVTNFVKHQSPHVKEQESSIPAPDTHGASTGQTPGLHPLNPSSLNPDTGLLNAESGDGGAPVAPAPAEKPAARSSEPEKTPKAIPCRLPEDWRPSDEDVAWATRVPVDAEDTALGLPADFVRSETLRFIDYWLGCGKAKVNWTATWRGWMRREAQEGRPTRAIPNGRSPTPLRPLSRTEENQAKIRQALDIAEGRA